MSERLFFTRKSERINKLQRIDYRILNNTGEKVSKMEDLKESENVAQKHLSTEDQIENTSSVVTQLEEDLSLIREEIEDFIDENPINRSIVAAEDIETCVNKVSKFRTEFRIISKNISKSMPPEKFENLYAKGNATLLTAIKEYIINANERKSQIRSVEKSSVSSENLYKLKKQSGDTDQMKQAAMFLINEVTRITKELSTEFSKNKDDHVSDEEITQRKEDLPSNLLKLDQLSNKFQRCLEIIPDSYENRQDVIKFMTTNYNELVVEKESYERYISNEITKREIAKEKSFQVSTLNINLNKFKGYGSELDIYSFQYEFEKLHLKTTPKKMLPDLLKYNYLAEPALALVKSLDDINEIWTRLKKAYGDPKTLLANKLASVKKIGPLWKVSGERLKDSLISLINGMTDLITLSKYHGIEAKLFHGDGLDTIYGLMGESRVTKWISKTCEEKLEEEDLWKQLILFLEKELRIQQELSHIKKQYVQEPRGNGTHLASNSADMNPSDIQECHLTTSNQDRRLCSFCNEDGHYVTRSFRGSESVQYYSCPKFVGMTPLERFKELRRLGFCYMCLFPGALQNSGKHGSGSCQNDFTCKHPSHDRYRRKHVLVCQEHSEAEDNKKILDTYKERFILQRPNIPEFSKNIKLSFVAQQAHVTSPKTQDLHNDDDDAPITENGIYLLQKILVDGQEYTVFFDTGCSDMVARYDAVKRIGDRAKLEVKGPISLGGVGNLKTESQYGIYQVRLPLVNGNNAVLTGVCLDQITNTFPNYPIEGEISSDIQAAYSESGQQLSNLPKLPNTIGGDVDFMLGTKYLRYHPEPIFALPSGLTIYKSPFVSSNGIQGVIGGPHHIITEIDKIHHNGQACQHAYLSNQYKLFQVGYKIDPDIHLLSMKYNKDIKNEMATQLTEFTEIHDTSCYLHSTLTQKYFEEVENAASEILYRCINCRNCQKCKNGERIENISIKEEIEQDLINNSITVDVNAGKTVAKLPLLADPAIKLVPNHTKALAVYKSQLKRLTKNAKDREDVITSEAKLQSLGHVEYIKNLSQKQQEELKCNPIKNYIPWTTVWKDNSISTPCRIVFNASMPTDSQFSLNDILAKGKNNMNMLVEILIRWRTHAYAFHSDVQKMYNTVQLREEDWCLQRYIWQENLDPRFIPEEKVIKTLIYGVKSSGNQAEHALRLTANLSMAEFPEVNEIVQNDVYVDDCMSGEAAEELCHQRADELNLVLTRGGFCLKGFTFSKHDPPKELSVDGRSINVAGMCWFSNEDYLKLDISPLDFTKQRRGKRSSLSLDVPKNLSRKQCLSKVAEIFDLTGMLTPITAAMKLDLHTLVQRKLQWDDIIPDDLKAIWISNFDMIQELQSFKFNRAVVPEDATNLDIHTIECADASKDIACVAIYVRIHRKCGEYSCQLIFARSKLVPDGMTTPRAELFAANINAHTGEVVRRALRKFHKSSLKLTDSQVTLHWLHNQELPLKQWVSNRVVEILRFTDTMNWMYVQGKDMPADIGTRKGATLCDVSDGSVWQIGYEWMRKDK